MKVIEPSFIEIEETRLLQKIEMCGRVCYKSEDKITDISALNFVKKICVNNHGSVLEHYAFVLRIEKNYYKVLKEANLSFFDLTNISFPIVSFNLRAFINYYNENKNNEVLLPITHFIHILHPELVDDVDVKFDETNISLIEDFSLLNQEERDLHQRVSIKLTTDRGVTHELVRHRLASYSQESTRYCNYSKDKFNNEITVILPRGLNEESYKVWYQSMLDSEKAYFEMIKLTSSPQLCRSVLPNCLKTEIVVTCSIKEWKLIFDLRCSPFAHPDIVFIMKQVRTHFISKGYVYENN